MSVLAVVGVGGMGEAIARRSGSGRTVVLADFNEATLERVAASLRGDGFDVHTNVTDVSDAAAVAALAEFAASLGPVTAVAHTAGLSPTQAPTGAILRVDLLGVAVSLEEFAKVIAPGAAYSIAKRGNQVRVQAASKAWGARGARINSISPGVISTPMGQEELAGESGAGMRVMVEGSGTGRLGTPNDIANATAFLLSDEASFVTGTDLLVDGGTVAGVRSGFIALPQG